MPKAARIPGLLEVPPCSSTVDKWMKGLLETCFSSQTAFLEHIVNSEITALPNDLEDTVPLRGVLLAFKMGMVTVVDKCTVCKKKAVLGMRHNAETYAWKCPTQGHNHMEKKLVSCELLSKIPQLSWLAFFNFLTLLRLGRPLHDIEAEIRDAQKANIKSRTLTDWRRLYQSASKTAKEKTQNLMIGGKDEVVVLDETAVGVHAEDGFSFAPKGIGKFTSAVRTSLRARYIVKKRIAKRLPARTVWRKPASATPMKRIRNKPARDSRSKGKWLCAAVTVGRKSEMFTHAIKKKRFTFRLLPRKENAIMNHPRGFEEIRDTIKACIKPRSIWFSTSGRAP